MSKLTSAILLAAGLSMPAFADAPEKPLLIQHIERATELTKQCGDLEIDHSRVEQLVRDSLAVQLVSIHAAAGQAASSIIGGISGAMMKCLDAVAQYGPRGSILRGIVVRRDSD